MSTDVVVIGGGCGGAANAYFLSRAGLNVTLLEKDALASAASGVATGFSRLNLRDADFGPQADLIRNGLPIFRRTIPIVMDESGIDCQFQAAPGLTIPLTEEAWEELKSKAAKEGHRILSASAARELEPGLGEDIMGATWDNDRRRVDASSLTRAYAKAAELRGAKIVLKQAEGLDISDGKVTGVRVSGGETIPCGAVVIAMGITAPMASEWLGVEVPVVPVKGERLIVRYSGPHAIHMLSSQGVLPGYSEHGHVLFMGNGLVSIGSTFEHKGYDATPSDAARERLMNTALHIYPSLIDGEIQEQLVGLRPIPRDGVPILGPVKGVENAYMISGHSTINCSAIYAEITRDLIMNGKTDLVSSIEPFLLERFEKPQDGPSYGVIRETNQAALIIPGHSSH